MDEVRFIICDTCGGDGCGRCDRGKEEIDVSPIEMEDLAMQGAPDIDVVGEFVGCTHGLNGQRRYCCPTCAEAWHSRQATTAEQRLAYHRARIAEIQGGERRLAKAAAEK